MAKRVKPDKAAKPKTVQKYRTVKTVKYKDHETAAKFKPADTDKMRFRIRRRADGSFDLLMMERIREKTEADKAAEKEFEKRVKLDEEREGDPINRHAYRDIKKGAANG